MQPDYNLRIRSMAKALAETIIPAIDSDNRSALEQAHIVLPPCADPITCMGSGCVLAVPVEVAEAIRCLPALPAAA